MAVSRPALFIPGLPGSHLRKVATDDLIFLDVSALLSRRDEILPDLLGPDDLDDLSVIAAHPIRSALRFLFVDLAKQADSLYDVLRSIGYRTPGPNDFFRELGWDWRKPVDDARVRADFEDCVLNLERRTGRKPVAIVHSTGGLVLRAALERTPELADHLESVIAFGVPWGGTLKPLPFLCGKKRFWPLTEDEARLVMAHAWAAYDLLPPAAANDALGLTLDDAGSPVDILQRRDWFDDGLAPAMGLRADRSQDLHANRKPEIDLGGRTLPVANVVGFGADTILRSRIDSAGAIGFEVGKADSTLDDGDGTVPRRSAAWLAGPGVRTLHLPVGLYPGVFSENRHSTLWANPGGQDLLWNLLGDEPWLPFFHVALDEEDVEGAAETLRVRLVGADESGRKLPNLAVKFSGLTGGAQAKKVAEQPGGRALFEVPRRRIRKTSDGRFRRLEVQGTWDGAAGPVSRRFLIEP